MTTPAPDLAAVLDLIVDSVTIQDARGRLVYANAVAARRLGFATPEELLRADPVDLRERYTMYDEHGEPFPRDQLPGRLALTGQDAADVLVRYRDELTGEEQWANVHAAPITAADGTRSVVNVVRDVTERVNAETALREREARLRAVLAAMPDLMFIQDPDGTFLDFHADDDSRLFVPPTSFIGKRPVDVLPPDVAAVVLPALKQTAQTGEPSAVEYAMPMAGEERHYEARIVRLDDSRLVSIVRDLTDRVRAEAALDELRRFEERVAAASPAILYVYDVIENRNVYVNDALPRLLGYAPEQLTEAGTEDLWALMHPDDLARWPAMGAQVAAAEDGEVVEQSFRLRHADGGWRWLAQRVTVLSRQLDGLPHLIVAAALDVTALREAEAAWRESEARYRAVVDSQTELVSRFTLDTTLTFVNDAYCRYFGRTREELIGSKFLEFDPPSTHESTLAAIARIGQSSEPVTGEDEERLPDGSIGRVQWISTAIRDTDGNLVEMQSVGRDITELRRTEGALRESEARYKAVVDSQTEMICRYLPDTTLTFVNDAYCRYWRQTKEALLGRSILDAVPGLNRGRLMTYFRSLVTDARPSEIEVQVDLPNGTVGFQHWVDYPIFDAAGKVIELQGVGRDVTDLRRAEEALAASKRLADRVGAASPDIIYVFDVRETRTVYVNDAASRVLGYTPEQFAEAEATDPRAMRHPDDLATLEAAVAQVATADDGEVVEFAFRMRHADGRWRWLAARVTVLEREPDGQPRLVVGAASDITALREAEAELRASEARYRSVVDLQTELVSRYLPDSTLTFVNDTYCRFMGQTREQLIGTPFLQSLAPSERAAMLRVIDSIMATSEPLAYEHPVVLRDGSIRHLQWVDRAIRDADGQIVELQGVGRDITELRRAQEALRDSEARLRLALEGAGMGSWQWHVNDDWVAWTEHTGPIYGMPAGSPGIRLRDLFALIHPDDRKRMRGVERRRAADGRHFAVEFRVVWPDGSVHWLAILGRAAARDERGRVTRILGISMDITERKRAEEELRELGGRLLAVQDEERRRLAQELHEQTAQAIAALSLDVASVRIRLGAATDPEIDRLLAEAETLGQQVLQEIRTVSYVLHPPSLDRAGLAVTLREYAAGFGRRSGVAVDVARVADVGPLPQDVEVTLFRVAQEALTNVARHAGTDSATVALSTRAGKVVLRVADEGRGMDGATSPEDSSRLGVGIAGMQARVRQLGGEMDIDSGADGTVVTARLPRGGRTRARPHRSPSG